MGYSYHMVDADKIPFAVAFLVGYKGSKLDDIRIGNNTNSYGKKSLSVSPGLRKSTLTEGISRIQDWTQPLNLEGAKSIDALSYDDKEVSVRKLWNCNCVEEDGYYKIRKRGVVDKCFICEETSANRPHPPDIEKGIAYLKSLQRKEIEIKSGRGVS